MAQNQARQRKQRQKARHRRNSARLQARRCAHNGFTKFGGSGALIRYLTQPQYPDTFYA